MGVPCSKSQTRFPKHLEKARAKPLVQAKACRAPLSLLLSCRPSRELCAYSVVKCHPLPCEQSPPVMLRMLSAMPVGVTVPWVVSPCRMVIMVSSLFKVLVRQDLQTISLLTTCTEKHSLIQLAQSYKDPRTFVQTLFSFSKLSLFFPAPRRYLQRPELLCPH